MTVLVAPPVPCRCGWAKAKAPADQALLERYHDTEWGVPLHEDRRLFEFLLLEGMQAGLSWLTILKRREAFRRAFDGFDPRKIARYDENRIQGLMADAAILRNRPKIAAAVANARSFLQIQREFGSFDAYIWGFVGGRPLVNRWTRLEQLPACTPLSERISADLRTRGFRFVGPTIVYAHMQATGMVNDHLVSCFRWRELREAASGDGA